MKDNKIREIRIIRENPRFRHYPEYKESGVEWIKKIPAHWEIIRGKFILRHKKEINSDFQCDNLLSLTLNGVLRKDMSSSEGLRPSDYKTYQVFYPDNLVFKLIDLENIQTSRVGIVHEKGIMSPVYIRLESNSDLHERYYFYQYYDLYKKHIFNFLGKGVRSSLSPSDLLEIPLVFPLPSEQCSISNFLDRKTEQIDELIRIKERRIELLQEQRTALINQAVTKGLDPNVEMKPSGVEWIGEIPSNWRSSRLKFHLSENSGGVWGEDDEFEDGTYVLRSTEITIDGHWDLQNVIKRKLRKEEVEKFLLKKGDLIVTKSSGSQDHIGKTGLVDDTIEAMVACYSNFVQRLRPQRHINSKFLHYFMNCSLAREQYKYQSETTTGLANLNTLSINELFIAVPPQQEQDQIVNFLDHKTQQIDQLIAAEQQKIELLKEYRQSLISEAVTGKIDVRNEV